MEFYSPITAGKGHSLPAVIGKFFYMRGRSMNIVWIKKGIV